MSFNLYRHEAGGGGSCFWKAFLYAVNLNRDVSNHQSLRELAVSHILANPKEYSHLITCVEDGSLNPVSYCNQMKLATTYATTSIIAATSAATRRYYSCLSPMLQIIL